jgi:CMP-N,N'-diacetyllegionaminic acid synthase
MNRLCTICARGGSKGVKGKNTRMLSGIPLIVHSLNHANQSKVFDAIAVSSDSDEILSIARDWGCDFLIERPKELATDFSSKLNAIKHCVEEVVTLATNAFDVVVDLDVTSPLREVEDILNVLRLLESDDTGNVLTAMPSKRSPYFNILEIDSSGILSLSKNSYKPIYRRQDSPKCFDMNASIYAWKINTLFEMDNLINKNTKLYVMPESRSIDIDTEIDFEFVEFLLERKLNQSLP